MADRQQGGASSSRNVVKDPIRVSEFKCNFRFRNDPPEIPSDLRMVLQPKQPSELAAFRLTEAERTQQRDLIFEPDLGIHASILDLEKYIYRPPGTEDEEYVRPPLDPEDLALLEEGTVRPQHFWLVPTMYVTNEEGQAMGKARLLVAGPGTAAAAARQNGERPAGPAAHSRAQQIAEIEKQFEQAAQPPRHKLKPHLTPVSVVPLVPDLTLWDRDLCTVILDTDPTPEGEPYVRLGPADRHHLTARSYMRLATISGQGGRFLGFLTPSELAERLAKEPGALAEGEGVEGPPEEGHFDWIREYVYEKQSTSDGTLNDTLVLLREEGGRALFCPLDQRLLLERKGNRRMAKNGTIADEVQQRRRKEVVAKLPAEATIRKRDREAEEAQRASSKRLNLFGLEGPPEQAQQPNGEGNGEGAMALPTQGGTQEMMD